MSPSLYGWICLGSKGKSSIERMGKLGQHDFPNTSIVNNWAKIISKWPRVSWLRNDVVSKYLSIDYLLITKGKGTFTMEGSGNHNPIK